MAGKKTDKSKPRKKTSRRKNINRKNKPIKSAKRKLLRGTSSDFSAQIHQGVGPETAVRSGIAPRRDDEAEDGER
jgi:hypothetical protein